MLVPITRVTRVTVKKAGFLKKTVLDLKDEKGYIAISCEGGAVRIMPQHGENERLFSLAKYNVEFTPFKEK